jgi:hypothetical protein
MGCNSRCGGNLDVQLMVGSIVLKDAVRTVLREETLARRKPPPSNDLDHHRLSPTIISPHSHTLRICIILTVILTTSHHITPFRILRPSSIEASSLEDHLPEIPTLIQEIAQRRPYPDA